MDGVLSLDHYPACSQSLLFPWASDSLQYSGCALLFSHFFVYLHLAPQVGVPGEAERSSKNTADNSEVSSDVKMWICTSGCVVRVTSAFLPSNHPYLHFFVLYFLIPQRPWSNKHNRTDSHWPYDVIPIFSPSFSSSITLSIPPSAQSLYWHMETHICRWRNSFQLPITTGEWSMSADMPIH